MKIAKDSNPMPYIIEENGMIIDVSNAFLQLSDFNLEDLIDQSTTSIWNDQLRINKSPTLILTDTEAYMFTKSLEAKCVFITRRSGNNSNRLIYTFTEKANSRLDIKFPYINYLSSMNMTGIAIYSAPDFILLKTNQRYLDFFDTPYNQMSYSIGQNFSTLMNGSNGSRMEEITNTLIASGTAFMSDESPLFRLEKGTIYLKTSIVPIYENGQIQFFIENSEDVTDIVLNRKKLELQNKIIKEQKEELEAIIENMSDGLAVFDKDGRYILKNSKIEEIAKNTTRLGRTVDKIGESHELGERYFDIYGTPLKKEELPNLRVLNGEVVKNQIVKFNNGKREFYFKYSGRPIFDEIGQFKYGVLNFADITDDFEKDIEIKKQREQLEAIIENSPDAICLFDKDNNIIKSNSAKLQLFENHNKMGDASKSYNFIDMNGIPLIEDEVPLAYVKRGIKFKNKIVSFYKDKKLIHLSASGVPIFDQDGHFEKGIISFRDITDNIETYEQIKNQQFQLLRSEKEKREALEASIKLKDEFLYLITHEFKTPLAVINSALQTIDLIYKDDVTDRLTKFLNTIKINTNRQLRLVNNLLDITRIHSGYIKFNYSLFDIQYVTMAIVKSVETYSNQKGVRLNFSSSLDKKEFFIDEEKYERIMLNLLSNALKFTPTDKNIFIELSTIKHATQNMLCINIRDEGIGIPKEKHLTIFERFGQVDNSLSRHAEGTGLGLHLVKLLLDSLEGQITLESEEGKGSSFTILLPIKKGADIEERDGISLKKIPSFEGDDHRIIQAASIEFSDIYFD